MQQIVLDLLRFFLEKIIYATKRYVYAIKEKHYIKEKGILILQSKSFLNLLDIKSTAQRLVKV